MEEEERRLREAWWQEQGGESIVSEMEQVVSAFKQVEDSKHRRTRNRKQHTRGALTVPSLRWLRFKLMHDSMVAVSSMSLALTLPGSAPVVLQLPGCVVNSSRVTRNTLLLSGWTSQGRVPSCHATTQTSSFNRRNRETPEWLFVHIVTSYVILRFTMTARRRHPLSS